jgi:hypothetical protein
MSSWKTILHLGADEAEAIAADLERGREALNRVPAGKWD